MYPNVIEIRSGSRGEDRAGFFANAQGFVAVVADGAGGTGGGAEAATDFCNLVAASAGSASIAWEAFMANADIELATSAQGGLTTGVIVEVRDGILRGASVGDSGAILYGERSAIDLTGGQSRKPLLGSGLARPSFFGPFPFVGRLLLATDGVLKYVTPSRVAEIVSKGSLQSSALSLVEAAKLRNGDFYDDIAILLCASNH